MDKPKILHLTLKRKYFDLIAYGKKTVEYREAKGYWIERLDGRKFDEIHFRNGYTKDRPFMRIKHRKTVRKWCFNYMAYRSGFNYLIYLGEILEIRNWNG